MNQSNQWNALLFLPPATLNSLKTDFGRNAEINCQKIAITKYDRLRFCWKLFQSEISKFTRIQSQIVSISWSGMTSPAASFCMGVISLILECLVIFSRHNFYTTTKSISETLEKGLRVLRSLLWKLFWGFLPWPWKFGSSMTTLAAPWSVSDSCQCWCCWLPWKGPFFNVCRRISVGVLWE